jgi:hypothetical protein
MNRSRVTYCPPAKAAGHCLDDVVAFLRAGCPLSTARLFAESLAIVTDTLEMEDELWAKFRKYIDKIICDGVYDFQMEIYERCYKDTPLQN